MLCRCATAITLAALLLAACVGPSQAVYADQAGQNDWLQQHVGRVSLAAFAAKPRARLFVASRAGAVAALSLEDGSLLWRRVLAEDDEAVALQASGTRVLTLSSGGSQLTAWDAGSGAAMWGATVASSSELAGPDAAALTVAADGKRSVAVAVAAGSAKVRRGRWVATSCRRPGPAPRTATPGAGPLHQHFCTVFDVLQGFAAASGELLWTASLTSTRGAAVVKAAQAADGGTWVASLQPG